MHDHDIDDDPDCPICGYDPRDPDHARVCLDIQWEWQNDMDVLFRQDDEWMSGEVN